MTGKVVETIVYYQITLAVHVDHASERVSRVAETTPWPGTWKFGY